MPEEGSVRVVVEGRVQGVGFRAWTRRLGRKLGIRGWVANRPDGAVEIHAGGEEARLTRFLEAVRQGPSTARVREVREMGEAGELPPSGFEIRHI